MIPVATETGYVNFRHESMIVRTVYDWKCVRSAFLFVLVFFLGGRGVMQMKLPMFQSCVELPANRKGVREENKEGINRQKY